MKTQTEVPLRSRARLWFAHVHIRHGWLLLISLIIVAVFAGFFGRELEGHIRSLESWVTQLGFWGMLVFVGLVVVWTSLFLPESLLGVAAGVLFGLLWGVAIILLANILAAALQYGIARRLLREPIRRKLGRGKLAGVIQGVASDGSFTLQLLLRLTPVNQTIISYSLGAAGTRFSPFLAACLGMLPAIIVEVYLGHTGKRLALVGAGVGHAGWQYDALLFAGLLVAATGVGFASRAAYKSVIGKTKAAE